MKKGEKFYTKNESVGSGIYFVHSGKVEMEEGGQDITQGGYFGVVHTVLQDQIINTAVAVEDCEVGYLSKETIAAVIVQMPRIYEGAKRKPMRQSSTIIEPIALNKLKKHRILGVGTFGKVWLVTNGTSKEAYALKVQRKRILLQHQQVEGVMREMNVMAKINHPFVLKLINVYQDSDAVLMLVKLIQGGELYGIMKRARRNILPERDAKFYGSGILEGLCYMHSFDILYRDLKPEVGSRDSFMLVVGLCITWYFLAYSLICMCISILGDKSQNIECPYQQRWLPSYC